MFYHNISYLFFYSDKLHVECPGFFEAFICTDRFSKIVLLCRFQAESVVRFSPWILLDEFLDEEESTAGRICLKIVRILVHCDCAFGLIIE